MFRRLRDDLLADKIFEGMIRRGGNELLKRSVGNLLESCGTSVGQAKQFEQSDSSNGEAGVDTIGTKTKHEKFQTQKTFSNNHRTHRPEYTTTVGAGA